MVPLAVSPDDYESSIEPVYLEKCAKQNCTYVMIQEDFIDESVENFTVSLIAAHPRIFENPEIVRISIVDNDGMEEI